MKPALAGFLLVLFVASTQAADYIPAGQPVPESIRWVNGTASGVDTSAFARVGTTGSRFPVPLSSSTVGKLVRGALRRGLGAAGWAMLLRDLVNGAGWAINELQDQVVVPGTDPSTNPTGTQVACISSGAGTHCSASRSGTASMVQGVRGYETCTPTTQGDPSYWWSLCRMPGQGFDDNVPAAVSTLVSPMEEWGSGSPETVVSDAQVGDLVKYSPQVINAVLIDPDTGAPIRTPELIAALNNLRRALEAANGLDPGPDLEADPSYGSDGTPSQTQSEWPGFCDWATTVCDFIDWVKAEDTDTEPVEVPWEEETPIEQDWSSGLGGGSCPGAIAIPISIGGYAADISWEYAPLCEAATWIRQIAVPLCVLLAVFIVGGYRRSASA